MSHTTDFLVLGSGIAGLSFALKAASLGRVTVITKKERPDSATNLAQGGIAAVLDSEDSFAAHIQDTLRAGDGLCHEEVVRLVVENGPERVKELLALGIPFSRDRRDPERLDLGREGGHSARRIIHAMDRTGSRIEQGLLERINEHPEIEVLENHLAVDLLIGSRAGVEASPPHRDRCLGAYVLNRETREVETWLARATVLCTGGAGKVYLYTTNPDIATGDGIAMAWRAGAAVANLEFVQFHPTCLYHPQAKNFLISEAVRGEGGRLIDSQGRPFMHRYDPRGDLATRDTVARAIDHELKASGADCVYLDISHRPPEFVRERFPHIYATCLKFGIDITREPIPVVPAAHYLCGGVLTDTSGLTTLEDLYALGEVACTGLHGANRLASNSLLEAVVFAHQAFLHCREAHPGRAKRPFAEAAPWSVGSAEPIDEGVLISHNWDQIRRLMWNYVGIVRREKRLKLVEERLRVIRRDVEAHYREYLPTADLIELRNLSLVAELIVRCAISRKESRGLHYLLDYPAKDDLNFRRDTVLVRT